MCRVVLSTAAGIGTAWVGMRSVGSGIRASTWLFPARCDDMSTAAKISQECGPYAAVVSCGAWAVESFACLFHVCLIRCTRDPLVCPCRAVG